MPLVPVLAVATLKRRALRQGVFGQSLGWRLVAVVVFGGPLLRRLVSKQSEVLAVDTLRPGESILVTTSRRPSRRRRS